MNGYDIFKKALVRLGLESFEQKLAERAEEYLNEICADLNLQSIDSLSKEINLSTEYIEALTVGLSMMFSYSEGDTQKNKLFCDLYNAKRARVLSKTEKIQDTLPKGGV